MSEAETIKQFMVGLGFKVDENSFKKFDAATGVSTRRVMGLGAATVAAAAATELFVAKVSRNLDQLYFASKRTGASAQEINAFTFAVSQMGGTADGALSSMENLARFIRSNPGSGGFLTRALGVKPESLKDVAKVMEDLSRTFRQMPFYLASRYAGMLGIDEKTLLAMRDGSMGQRQDKYQDMVRQHGVDLDALTASGKAFTNQMKELEASFGLFANRLAGSLLPFMSRLNTLLLAMSSESKGSAIKTFLDWVGENSYLPGTVDSIGEASPFGRILEGMQEVGRKVGNKMNAPRGIRNNNPGNLRRWGNMPIAGGFASFPTAAEGLRAMAKQLNIYGGRGWDTIAEIVQHWAPSADGNNEGAYRKALAKMTGFGVNQQLNMNDPATLQRLMGGIIMHENGRNPYDAALVSSAARAGAGRGATLNQTNNFNITSQDPQAAADAVASEQGRVNQQAVRNLIGAVQ